MPPRCVTILITVYCSITTLFMLGGMMGLYDHSAGDGLMTRVYARFVSRLNEPCFWGLDSDECRRELVEENVVHLHRLHELWGEWGNGAYDTSMFADCWDGLGLNIKCKTAVHDMWTKRYGEGGGGDASSSRGDVHKKGCEGDGVPARRDVDDMRRSEMRFMPKTLGKRVRLEKPDRDSCSDEIECPGGTCPSDDDDESCGLTRVRLKNPDLNSDEPMCPPDTICS